MIVTLKRELHVVFCKQDLGVSNIGVQRYDSISNMKGEWNGLQALLFLNHNLYAYYVHCFTHRLQLSLLATSRKVIMFHFFKFGFNCNCVFLQ